MGNLRGGTTIGGYLALHTGIPSATLESIKTVDGSGSGLDADLLDGKNASDFADVGHTHDSRYFTESEINNLLANKLNTSSYTASDVLTKIKTVDGSGSGLDADTCDGLHIHSGTNNEANKIVRTNSNGYIMAGFINTTSGIASGAPTRIYCSQDSYIRYYSPAQLAPYIPTVVTISTTAPSNPLSGQLWIDSSS